MFKTHTIGGSLKRKLFRISKNNNEHYAINFFFMVSGQAFSVFGLSLLRFALSLFVLNITGRADLFAIVNAASNFPRLFSPLGGGLADRFNRKKLFALYNLSGSFITLCLFFLILTEKPHVILISVVLVLLSTINAMYTPSVYSSVPLLVTENKIESANGMVMAVLALSDVVAPILGGFIYSSTGINLLIIISLISYLLSALMAFFIKIPFIKNAHKGNIVRTIAQDLKAGFVYVVKEPFIFKSMILAVLINLILSPLLFVGAPIVLRVTLRSSDMFYGFGMGIINFFALFGAVTVGLFTKKLKINNVHHWITSSALLILLIAIAVMPFMLNIGFNLSFILFISGMIPIAMILTILGITLISKIQKRTPVESLGKITAIVMMMAQCTSPLGQLIYGFIFEAYKISVYVSIFFISAALFVVAIITQRILKNETEIN
jgi:MFS family permease